jgi:hypothetical protein
MKPWIGVDFDSTLAHFEEWKGCDVVGKPLKPMIERVKKWRAEGMMVKIFTARAFNHNDNGACEAAIQAFCTEHFGEVLPITCTKDFGMIELWDDRAVRVEDNTGHCASHRNISDAARVVHDALFTSEHYPDRKKRITIIEKALRDHLNQT